MLTCSPLKSLRPTLQLESGSQTQLNIVATQAKLVLPYSSFGEFGPIPKCCDYSVALQRTVATWGLLHLLGEVQLSSYVPDAPNTCHCVKRDLVLFRAPMNLERFFFLFFNMYHRFGGVPGSTRGHIQKTNPAEVSEKVRLSTVSASRNFIERGYTDYRFHQLVCAGTLIEESYSPLRQIDDSHGAAKVHNQTAGSTLSFQK